MARTKADPSADATQSNTGGPIERQVRANVAALPKLDGARATYAEMAYRLARALDVESEEGVTGLAGASRELREVMALIWKGVPVERASDAVVDGLDQPVGGRPPVPAEVRDKA